MTIILTDPEVIQAIEARAKKQNTSIEELLRQTFVESPQPSPSSDAGDDMLKRAMHKIYNMARRYWQSVGAIDRANMTDDELAEKFGRFDENGIPRFKDELPDEPPVGSGAYIVEMIEETGGVPVATDLDGTDLDAILKAEFGDYLYQRMTRTDHD